MVDLMEEISYGRKIIAAVIEQGSGNQRKGMISTQAHLSGLQVETASGGCQLTELTERWVEDLRFYTSPTMMMMMVSPGLERNNFHFPVEVEEKRAGKKPRSTGRRC
jgi:hypothetical protein